MELGIKGRLALVTGAGRGIGRAVARALAAEGARVAVCSRTVKDIASLVEEMGGTARGHYGKAFDLVPEGAPAALVAELHRAFGHPEVVVQNLGGTLEISDPFCSLDDWRKAWRFNMEVAVELNGLLLPHMRQQRWGRIVHIASTASMENNGPVTYCTVKAALAAYARSMGRVLARDGVVVSAVLPGAVLTEGGHWDRATRTRPEYVEKYLAERCPLGRFGKPEEISGLVAFLCSELAQFCQGSIVPVDGGQSRHFFFPTLA